MKTIIFSLLLITATAFAAERPSALLREPGAVYLEDLAMKPVRLAAIADVGVWSKPEGGNFLGTIPRGRAVQLVALGEKKHRVRGDATQGGVVGWVDPLGITALRGEFTDSVRQNGKRKAEVDALIAKNEVALNMTPDEVSASLGKAQKKTQKLDDKGRADVWEFVRFVRVPQESTGYDREGRLVRNVVYVKVPAGKLTITFTNQLVTALEQTEGNTDVQAPIRLLPAPVAIVY